MAFDRPSGCKMLEQLVEKPFLTLLCESSHTLCHVLLCIRPWVAESSLYMCCSIAGSLHKILSHAVLPNNYPETFKLLFLASKIIE